MALLAFEDSWLSIGRQNPDAPPFPSRRPSEAKNLTPNLSTPLEGTGRRDYEVLSSSKEFQLAGVQSLNRHSGLRLGLPRLNVPGLHHSCLRLVHSGLDTNQKSVGAYFHERVHNPFFPEIHPLNWIGFLKEVISDDKVQTGTIQGSA